MVCHPAHCMDAAAALVWVAENAARFGGDPSRIHVMGHSAGAHIAAMLAVEPAILHAAGLPSLSSVKSFVCVSGVYSRELLEGRGGCRVFRRGWYLHAAFGDNPLKWDAAFPAGVLQHAARGVTSPFHLACSPSAPPSAMPPSSPTSTDALLLSPAVPADCAPGSAAASSGGATEKGVWRPPLLLVNAERDWGLQSHTAVLQPLLKAAGFPVDEFVLSGTDHLSIYCCIGVACSVSERELVPRVLAWLETK